MLKSYFSVAASTVLVVAITTGCSNSDNSTTEPAPKVKTYTGIFVDYPADGITYTCGSHTGVTSGGGLFTGCAETVLVSFSLGNLSLGSMTYPTGGVFTPRGLAAYKHPNDPAAATAEANNIAATLLSIDADGDATNGISITPANIAILNTTVPAGSNISDDAALVTTATHAVVDDPSNADAGMAVVTPAEAESHLDETEAAIENGDYDQAAPSIPDAPTGTGANS